MRNDTEAHRRQRRRAITVIGLGIAMVVALAAPALGHPGFPNDRPGFPNPNGGTGIGNQTPPYAPGSRPTLNMFTPFEQEGVIVNGAENTTVDVKVQVPTDWASPACGAVRTQVGNRQVGTVVPGWTCTIETVSGHQVLHWTGPQISPSQTFADGAQFFTFQVTMPSPATNTSYGAPGGPEGVFVEQRYADGFTSLWKSPNDTTRPTSTGGGHDGTSGQYTVATGLIRTVAGTPAPPPPGPGAAPAGTAPPSPKQTGPSPTPKQSGGGPAPTTAAEPPPTGQPTEAGPPSEEAQGSSTPTPTEPTEPSPGADPQAVEQLNQQRDDATGQGFRWQVLVGVLLAAVVVAGIVITVVKRRQRPS
ncbi:MAG: hypothetical protein ACRDRP_05920 [Pseudonocardiaceae bacterium]